MNVASRIPPEVAGVFEGFSCTDAFACSAEWELVVRPIIPCCGLYYVHRNRWNVQQPGNGGQGARVRSRQHQSRSMCVYVSINGEACTRTSASMEGTHRARLPTREKRSWVLVLSTVTHRARGGRGSRQYLLEHVI